MLPIDQSTFYEHQARLRDPERLPARAKRDAALRGEIYQVWQTVWRSSHWISMKRGRGQDHTDGDLSVRVQAAVTRQPIKDP